MLATTLGGTNVANTLFAYVTPAPTVTITGTNPTGATAAISVVVMNDDYGGGTPARRGRDAALVMGEGVPSRWCIPP